MPGEEFILAPQLWLDLFLHFVLWISFSQEKFSLITTFAGRNFSVFIFNVFPAKD